MIYVVVRLDKFTLLLSSFSITLARRQTFVECREFSYVQKLLDQPFFSRNTVYLTCLVLIRVLRVGFA